MEPKKEMNDCRSTLTRKRKGGHPYYINNFIKATQVKLYLNVIYCIFIFFLSKQIFLVIFHTKLLDISRVFLKDQKRHGSNTFITILPIINESK